MVIQDAILPSISSILLTFNSSREQVETNQDDHKKVLTSLLLSSVVVVVTVLPFAKPLKMFSASLSWQEVVVVVEDEEEEKLLLERLQVSRRLLSALDSLPISLYFSFLFFPFLRKERNFVCLKIPTST